MMKILSLASLRQMLTVPYVVLVLLGALVIGLLSYSAGSEAVDTLSERVLSEMVERIAQAVDKHVSGSEAVLETAFPTDVPAPVSIKDDLETLRTRFWLATTVHLEPNNYAYYGNRSGQFFGLNRLSKSDAELRLRLEGERVRTIYHYQGIRGQLGKGEPETRIFDPRERPWYKAGQDTAGQTWTSIYIDFKTLQLVGTRARRVNNAAGAFEGVVATDLSLAHLNDFLKGLRHSDNGYAFIVEPDGNLIATSRGPHLSKSLGNENARLNAANSDDPLIVATYRSVKALIQRPELAATGKDAGKDSAKGSSKKLPKAGIAQTGSFIGPQGEVIQTGYVSLRDAAGLDWIVAVAVPRSDFMHKVTDNLKRTALLALLAGALIIGTGVLVLNVIAKDLRRLAEAAKNMGEGIFDAKVPSERTDEIGDLAKSFAGMQAKLFTDRLTGISNREAMIRRIEDRIIRQRRSGDSRPFAVLFLDLNGFKQVNDQFGHDVGDRVLIEISQRLHNNLRESDMAARYGGDEFVVLLENVAHRAAAEAARDKLELQLAEPLKSVHGPLGEILPISVSASVGIALCPAEGNDLQTLLKRADEDMYSRKQTRVERTASRIVPLNSSF